MSVPVTNNVARKERLAELAVAFFDESMDTRKRILSALSLYQIVNQREPDREALRRLASSCGVSVSFVVQLFQQVQSVMNTG